jgi:hypothetical protein
MKHSLKLYVICLAALLASTAANAHCRSAPDSEEKWKPFAETYGHFLMENGDKCFLNLDSDHPTFVVEEMRYENLKHGKIYAYEKTPSKHGNALIYEADPGFKGEENIKVTMLTTSNGKSVPLYHHWKITVQ